MAATGYTPIQLYYSTTAAATPTAGNLLNGEMAINITDGKLFYKDNAGVVQTIASKSAATLPLTPANGGTGVANGANNTITFTGNYTLGITLSANTSLTFPTSGTVLTTSTGVTTGKSIAMAMIFGF